MVRNGAMKAVTVTCKRLEAEDYKQRRVTRVRLRSRLMKENPPNPIVPFDAEVDELVSIEIACGWPTWARQYILVRHIPGTKAVK